MDEQAAEGTNVGGAASSSTCVVTERWVERTAVVAVSGVVDMLTSPQLESAIDTALSQQPAAVVIDFTDVEFLASAGMGVLVAAHDKAGSDVKISVVAEGPATSRPLKLVGIADIVALYPNLEEALAARDT
ncbi:MULTISPECIES: STAS domain-containing protein [Mycolicibacterium]|uniref:Anti-sigma factor antagonist n=2 Tax=Mycolicibacterium TaxID=1866885 RepID=A1T9F8_MYCVP|nr:MULTISPECIES: STAS domain-containing protein [Mycolicibacterium]ABM13808.1 anti-sigma-factor antagonist [Mycolicibacterium vanbaalenii PYR-1]MCV7130479.1 STAS domain-containing protein [Mycolicibacterium vanbaalenii PYR-1]MDN4518853.1 STAS domain-containing protein [Mycolicibacterium austroafricanum]MDW5609833.1 STAS domain-containing protein [Mycolicibacterium sp. D5.8-2]PQP50660.1 anti-sigma factor antagonist [Mycolicibacterium austroafricanum]